MQEIGRETGKREMNRKWNLLAIITVSIVFLDQFSKNLIAKTMYLGQSFQIIDHILRIVYIKNPNAAFGIPVGSPLLMMILTSIATILLLVYFVRLKAEGTLLYVGLAMIISGAIGNLVDRFRMGQVVDFIEIGVRNFKWPVFNFADSSVTIGIVLILWVWIFGGKKDLTNHEDMI